MKSITAKGKALDVKYIIIVIVCLFVFTLIFKEHQKVLFLEKQNMELQESISDLESEIDDISYRVDELEY